MHDIHVRSIGMHTSVSCTFLCTHNRSFGSLTICVYGNIPCQNKEAFFNCFCPLRLFPTVLWKEGNIGERIKIQLNGIKKICDDGKERKLFNSCCWRLIWKILLVQGLTSLPFVYKTGLLAVSVELRLVSGLAYFVFPSEQYKLQSAYYVFFY